MFPTHVCATCSVLYKNFVNNQNTSSHTKLAARIPLDRYQQGIELGNYNVEGTKCACFFCKAVRDRLKSSGKLNTRSPNASHVEENESIQHRYNHIDNRKRICLFCLQRTQRMYLLKEYERITSFIPCYNPKSAFFPLTACATCIKKYGSYLNVQSDENLQNLRAQVAKQEYFYLNEDDTIHDLIENCSCFFCIKTLQIDEASERSITTRSSTSSSSNVENIQSVIPKEDIKISKKSVKKTMNVCGNCYNPFNTKHLCNRRTFVRNIVKQTLKKGVLDMVVWNLLRKRAKNLRRRRLYGIKYEKNDLKISNVPQNKVDMNLMLRLHKNIITSRRKRKEVITCLRKHLGRNFVDQNIRQKVAEISNELADLFIVRKAVFTHKIAKNITYTEETMVICTDVNKLIQEITASHSINNYEIKIGIDGGGKSLKVCLSVIDTDNLEKSSSVNKVFIIFLGYNLQENYDNVLQIWNLLNLNDIQASYTSDLKLCNIACGLKTCSSRNPCIYCPGVKEDGCYINAELRTYNSIVEDYKESRNSVIHVPVFTPQDPNEPILFHLSIPELHIFIGIQNFLFKKFKNSFQRPAMGWAKLCGCRKKANKGADFNGNQCLRLLQNTSILHFYLKSLNEEFAEEYMTYLEAFEAFKNVVTSCFGNYLDDNWEVAIQKFGEKYHKLDHDETPKVHILLHHVPQFIAYKGKGLGIYSEHGFEAVHFKFSKLWANYKREPDHPEFETNLLNCVINFNSMNLNINNN